MVSIRLTNRESGGTSDVGMDNQTPVAVGIGIVAETRFTGKIEEITLEVK